ncbi:MAG: iron-regulated protein [Planctomycetes bacterium]|jgi:putative iron-regulated protein|nr:iron-regulated protein [Planctomycetota bacterium]
MKIAHLAVPLLFGALLAQSDSTARGTVAVADVVQAHVTYCRELHTAAARGAERLQRAVAAFLERPEQATMDAARAAWQQARVVYGQLEALRFHGGPIDAVEPLLNAWPVDEAYIDHVIGRPAAGIVHDRTTFRVISAPVLEHANERGGETNISVGWHAIEFLLWGQDLSAQGPGNRPPTDFVLDAAPAADRRRAYLSTVTASQVQHLQKLAAAWAPAAPFPRQLLADPRDGLRRMLTGVMILTAFELAGERLAVAYETKDQEQEHSCFSDTTASDLLQNQRGIIAVLRGATAAPWPTHSIAGLVAAQDPAIAEHLVTCLGASEAALRAIPVPFDQACLGDDDAPGRKAVRAAIEALERQAEAIAIAGRLLGFDLPVRPGN